MLVGSLPQESHLDSWGCLDFNLKRPTSLKPLEGELSALTRALLGRAAELDRHLPPRACCRSCRWSRGSWLCGCRRTGGQWWGCGSLPPVPCCRRAGGSGQNPAWRTWERPGQWCFAFKCSRSSSNRSLFLFYSFPFFSLTHVALLWAPHGALVTLYCNKPNKTP